MPLLLSVLLSLPPAVGLAADPPAAPPVTQWEPLFEGVDLGRFTLTEPRPIAALVLRVNLAAPGVAPVVTAANGEREGETDAALTSAFLAAEKCQAAVNAAPFDKVWREPGGPENVSGLMMRDGHVISPPEGRPCLAFGPDKTVAVHDSDREARRTAVTAVCGFAVILRDGKVTGRDEKLHPRTAAGVSADGRTLWLLTVDGRQTRWSGGATTPELAQWLRALGADDAINLDGGGTTTMVVADAEGRPRVLNRPIHLGIPGRERPSGSHLGIRARPLVRKPQ